MRLFEWATAPLSDSVLLAAATDVEGHADNAAPALFGGLNSVLQGEESEPIALRWTWPDDVQLVVATPSVGLATAKARAALPELMPRTDAIYNLQRVLSLVHALQSREYERIREAVKDRWHQPARAALIPELAPALALNDPNLIGVCLSGAGPSIVALATGGFEAISGALEELYRESGSRVTIRNLGAEPHRVTSSELAAKGR